MRVPTYGSMSQLYFGYSEADQGAVAASSEIVLGAINSGFSASVIIKKVIDLFLGNKIEKRLYKSYKKRNLEGKPKIIDLPKHNELVYSEE